MIPSPSITYLPTYLPPSLSKKASRRALLIMLRSWAGIILLASDERKGLRTLLRILCDDCIDPVIRSAVFEVLDDLLRPLVGR